MTKFILLLLFILLSRIIEITLETVRIGLIGAKKIRWTTFVAFIEVLIWLFTFKIVFENLNSWKVYIVYAGGFAIGSFVGVHIVKYWPKKLKRIYKRYLKWQRMK